MSQEFPRTALCALAVMACALALPTLAQAFKFDLNAPWGEHSPAAQHLFSLKRVEDVERLRPGNANVEIALEQWVGNDINDARGVVARREVGVAVVEH